MTASTIRARIAGVIQRLSDNPAARLSKLPDGSYALCGPGAGRHMRVDEATTRSLLAQGLVRTAEPGRLAASPAAAAWLARRSDPAQPFAAQHGRIEMGTIVEEDGPYSVVMNRDESPIGPLSRPGKGGKRWLGAEETTAAERLRLDFERGQLQPRLTANWSASVSSGRRGSTVADLTEMALTARRRFDRAVAAVGPELSGVMVDVCCFLKGLEAIERERSWPARSAKLVLRLALASLARHYGLSGQATGRGRSALRHWGSDDYRPEIG